MLVHALVMQHCISTSTYPYIIPYLSFQRWCYFFTPPHYNKKYERYSIFYCTVPYYLALPLQSLKTSSFKIYFCTGIIFLPFDMLEIFWFRCFVSLITLCKDSTYRKIRLKVRHIDILKHLKVYWKPCIYGIYIYGIIGMHG